MAGSKLKTVFQTQGHTQALKDGTVKPRTFQFAFEDVPTIIEAFRRMVRGLEFDVSEMAITTYICARAHGKRFIALPVFLVRAFHQGAIVYNVAAGITHPKDLEGKKVGVNRGYTVTTGVWARGILQHEHGVDLNQVTWVLSGDEHVIEYQAPSNVVSMEKGKKLEEMLIAGEIAAAIGVEVDHPQVRPLIPNPQSAGFDALRSRGHYPINHTLVVKDELLQSHPDLAIDIFDTFVEAKRRYIDSLKAESTAPSAKNDQFYKKVMSITSDPLPYGLEANRSMIEAIIGYAFEQKIIARRPSVGELFPSNTHNLVG